MKQEKTSTPYADTLATQTGTEKIANPECLIEEIEGTPFNIINSAKHGWAIVWGQHRLTEWQKDREGALVQIDIEQWNIIKLMIGIVVQTNEEMKGDIGPIKSMKEWEAENKDQ